MSTDKLTMKAAFQTPNAPRPRARMSPTSQPACPPTRWASSRSAPTTRCSTSTGSCSVPRATCPSRSASSASAARTTWPPSWATGRPSPWG
ncbi:hypothetical protein G7085_16595 [Tessaracoccus sp. HDW20]|uniref:hypothetical protein n=1 Tax=Tessaracoccus coleopterorum TaxID=2714950 RepID=UPI0018D41765|nr:hypothetical protein [Tessaracoccus coleopterorum]NHB85667.1 hypothetical protein [Tessaracoccus coleopterorum]